MEKDVTPTPTDKAQEAWQNYLQKCCELGQLDHALTQIESQRLEIEKKLDITKRQIKAAAQTHNEIKQSLASKVQMPKASETTEAH